MNIFELWAQMIRSDQMSTVQVIQFMEDHEIFALWYNKKYEN